MQDSGTAIQNAAAQTRALLVAEAARRLDLSAENLKTEDGAVIAPDGRRLSYGDLVGSDMLHVQARATSTLKDPATFKVLGQSVPRVDIPAKVTGGAAYVQDMRLPGTMHARIARPPSYGARIDRLRHVGGRENAWCRQGDQGRQFSCCGRGQGVSGDQGDEGAVDCGDMERECAPAEAGRPCFHADQPAGANHNHFRASRSVRQRRQDDRGHIYAALSVARLDRPVLRRRAIDRRHDDGLDPYARRLS